LVIVVGIEAGLHIEVLRTVDIRDRNFDQLDLEVHENAPCCGVRPSTIV
jgi:hypothetical protein